MAGAGITGLTLALALAKFGAMVTIFERKPAIEEFGAGVQLSPNARKILRQLGVEPYLESQAFSPLCIDIYPFGAKKPVIGMRMGEAVEKRFGAPYAVMHRADLANALHRACRRFANIDIVFDTQAIDLEQHKKGLSVLAQIRGGGHRTVRPFAFIGADGVHSQTRTEFLGGQPARYSGYIAWRALIERDRLGDRFDLNNTSIFFGPGYHGVLYPLAARQTINVALFAPASERHAKKSAQPGRPRLSRGHRWCKNFKTLVAAGKESWTGWPLYTVSEKRWHDRQVGMAGDAAHALLPFQAQGAAMGIEDAAILAPLLVTELSADTAFERFEAVRVERVEKVAKVSVRNGKIFHMRWPASSVRNGVLKFRKDTAHLSDLDWLYGYEPTPDS